MLVFVSKDTYFPGNPVIVGQKEPLYCCFAFSCLNLMSDKNRFGLQKPNTVCNL